MALRNVVYALESNGAAMTAITIASGATVTSDGIKTQNCVGNSWLWVRFYDTSTCSIYREASYDNSNWGHPMFIYPWNVNTDFYRVASVVTTTNQFISLAAVDSNLGIVPVFAPYTRFKIASEKSTSKVGIYYIQQEEI